MKKLALSLLAAATLTLFSRVHAQVATIEVRAVHLRDGVGCVLSAPHGNKTETARLAGRSIQNDMHVGHFTGLRESIANEGLGGVEGQIANV